MNLIDRLASIEHRQWMQWAQKIIETEPGLSEERKQRWAKLMVPYDRLSEEWQEYDREWARHVLREIALQIEEEAPTFYGE